MSSLEIVSVRDAGPTDGGGDDRLWVVELREGTRLGTFRFSVPEPCRPEPNDLLAMIRKRASSFDRGSGAVDGFRGLERPHPEGSDRLVVQFSRAYADSVLGDE